jgi:RNA polymerase sigma-B factor
MTSTHISPPSATVKTSPPRSDRDGREDRATRTADLFRLAAQGDVDSRQHLIAQVIEANMGVAEAIAAPYRRRGVDEDDLRQVAYLALTTAASKFDVEAGHDFLSYAVPTIRGELRRYFRDKGWMVRPTRKIQELQSSIFAAQPEVATRLGRSPSVSELAKHLEEPVDLIEEALAARGCFTPTSLDRLVGSSGPETTIGELIGGEDEEVSAVEARVVLGPVVRRLCARDREVLWMRFLDDRTQREIGEHIGVTQTQVSRVLTRILAELRSQLEGRDQQPSDLRPGSRCSLAREPSPAPSAAALNGYE